MLDLNTYKSASGEDKPILSRRSYRVTTTLAENRAEGKARRAALPGLRDECRACDSLGNCPRIHVCCGGKAEENPTVPCIRGRFTLEVTA